MKSLRITLEGTETSVLGYVYLQEIGPGEVVRTEEIEPGSIHADYAGDGRLLGVEFLDAERADSNLMRRLAKRLNAPELAGIDLCQMCKTAV